MRQKGSALLPVIIILALIGIVGYLVYQNTQLKNGSVNPSPTITNTVTNLPERSPSPEPTANWKTYTDPENRYSFKYPQKYYQTTYNEGSDKGIQISSTVNGSSLTDGVMIKTLVISATSAKAFAQEQWNSEQNQPDFSDRGSISKIETSILDGKTIYTYTVSFTGNVKVIVVQLTNTTVLRIAGYYAGSEDKIPEYRNIVDQILSTFKFIK